MWHRPGQFPRAITLLAQSCSVGNYSHLVQESGTPKGTRQPRGGAVFQTQIWLLLSLMSLHRPGMLRAQSHGLLLLEAASGSAGRRSGRRVVPYGTWSHWHCCSVLSLGFHVCKIGQQHHLHLDALRIRSESVH